MTYDVNTAGLGVVLAATGDGAGMLVLAVIIAGIVYKGAHRSKSHIKNKWWK